MIDFRYHLVSIIAVFLALALGIVVGTTALNGGIVDTLRSSQNKIISDKRGLETQVRDLRNQVGRRDQFSEAVAQRVLGGRLADERVLFVAAPDASADTLRRLEQVVVLAGGTPTGVLRLREDLLDPTKTAVVEDVVAQVAPAGLELPDGTPVDRAAVELAAALVAKGNNALSEDAAAKVLGGFTGADLVQVQAPAKTAGTEPATLAVIVTGGSNGKDLDDAAKARQRAVLTLSRALDDRSSGVVVSGPRGSADPGGLLQALRNDGDLPDRVSSVDVADTEYGRVVVVLALNEQQDGAAGSYGEGPGSESAAPPPGQ
ncbi:MAG: hypothetical protein JWN77_757 [Frankiales bacterium]|nr:hypothetical protein [Frankiales bacterium]